MLKSRSGDADSFIMEFKVLDSDQEENLQDTVKAALKQVTEKGYAASLRADVTSIVTVQPSTLHLLQST